VRVRDHIAISTVAAAAARPRLGRDAALLWAGAVLIDVDHYLAFCLQERRLDPVAAVRFYGRAVSSEHWATRAFHAPLLVLAVLALGARVRPLGAVGVGMGLHVMLDTGHETRMNRARSAALERDRHTCQGCGARHSRVGTHLLRQPRLLPSYRPQNVVSLCAPCHARAHAVRPTPAS
jgi:hypothetical protein